MRSTFLLGAFLILKAIAASAQVTPAPQKSPVEVVEEYWKMEANGGMLTEEGWYKASIYFIRFGTSARKTTFHVIRNGRDRVEETAHTQNWAEVSVSTDEVGQIDAMLHFKPLPRQGPKGVQLLKGPLITFDLVLTEKQWPRRKDGSRGEEVASPQKWLIACTDDAQWVNVDAAIRYVTEMREKVTDPAMRRNADQTLRRLQGLR